MISGHYNSLDGTTFSAGWLGPGWSHSYSAQIRVLTPTVVQAIRANRKGLVFNLIGAQWVGDGDVLSSLTQQVDGSGNTVGWRYVTGDNEIEVYDGNGRLSSIAKINGVSQSLTYDGTGLLTAVTDSFGRQLTLGYDGSSRLASLTDPTGAATTYNYQYGLSSILNSVGRPGGTSLIYSHESTVFPDLLTGVTDENSKRKLTWAYDTNGNAISSQMANGAGLVSVAYNSPSDGLTTTTDSLSRSQTYSYAFIENTLRTTVADLTGAGVPLQSNWTYFSDGSVASYTDFLGNMTCYGYSARGRESARIEGLPYTSDACANLGLYPFPANGRVIATAWHPVWRLQTKVDRANKHLQLHRKPASSQRAS